MGYKSALVAAGAAVHSFKYFGSYQGDWWAHVTYNGVTGFITGCFGSCTVCDSFESEFGYSDDDPNYQERLADFGRRYLDEIIPKDKAIEISSTDLDWDLEAEEMVNWIKERPE